MFSQDAYDNLKLIENTFIVGLNNENISSLLSSSSSFNLNTEILFSFPENKTKINSHVLDFIYPCGASVSFTEHTPKFNAIILTNEKGMRTYIYVLKCYEKLDEESFMNEISKENSISRETIFRFNQSNVQKSFNESFITRQTTNTLKVGKGLMKRTMFLPISLCILSSYSANDFFKSILMEFFYIMKSRIPHVLSDTLLNYRYSEVLNYILFLNNVLKPPPRSKMTLNLHFSSFSFFSPSNQELPFTNDSCINILFKSLEISTILKLYVAILTEKQIIFIANQNYLIYNITEALQRLIFPFKWIHTYIPVLPVNQYDYLDAPTPYIMGVLSHSCDAMVLKQKYTHNVICDINTSQVFENYTLCLPYALETKVRKKIQLIKNPEIYRLEDFPSKVMVQSLYDFNPYTSFEENIQYVFFSIVKETLGNYKKYLNEEKTFDSQKFLEEQVNEEYRDFWEKIICTQIFEYFILCNQYLDDSPTKSFNNIIKYQNVKNKKTMEDPIYFYTMNLPNNISNLFMELENRARLVEGFTGQNMSKYIEKCKLSVKSYNTVISEKDKDSVSISPMGLHSNKRKISEMKSRKSTEKSNLPIITNEVPYLKKNISFEKRFNQSNLLKIETSSKLEKDLQDPGFYFYGNKGFLYYINELFTILNFKEIGELGYQNEILCQVNNCLSFNNERRDNYFDKIDEALAEMEIDQSNDQMSNNSFSFSPSKSSKKIKPIIEIPKSEQYQYQLILAFYLDYLTNKNEKILELYNNVVEISTINFPKINYLNFLDKFDLNKLRYIYSTSKHKLITKITNYKIQNIMKTLQNVQLTDKLVATDNQSVDSEDFFRSESYSNVEENKKEKSKEIPLSARKENCEELDRFKESIKFAENYTPINTDFSQKKKMSLKNGNMNIIRLDEDELTPRTRRNSARLSIITSAFDGRTNAKRLIDNLKHSERNINEKVRTFMIINNFRMKNLYSKEPISLMEDISLKVFSFICKNALNKYMPELLNKKLYADLVNKEEFLSIKESIGELQMINLSILHSYSQNAVLSFWLNAFNFLTIFTIIYKKEILMNNYEWYRFLKSSTYNIGGLEFSLYEIEYCILKNKVKCHSIYFEKKPHFAENDMRKKFEIKMDDMIINFGVFYPIKYTPSLAIYFPSNVMMALKLNAIEYFSKYLIVDLQKKSLCFPEFLFLIDSNFSYNPMTFEEFFPKELNQMLEKLPKGYAVTSIKFDWMINYCNIKGFDITAN